MTKKQQEEFLDKQCEDNTTWAAQQMLLQLKPKQRHQIAWALRKLNKVLYKSWAKDLTLNDLIEAADMSSKRNEGTGALAE